jgi:hypothetical protein
VRDEDLTTGGRCQLLLPMALADCSCRCLPTPPACLLPRAERFVILQPFPLRPDSRFFLVTGSGVRTHSFSRGGIYVRPSQEPFPN